MLRDRSILRVFSTIIIGFVLLLLLMAIFDYFYSSDLGGYKINSNSGLEYFISLSKPNDTVFINNLGYPQPAIKIKTITYYDSIFYGFASNGGRVLNPFIFPMEIVYDNTFILAVQYPLDDFGGKYTYPEALYKDTTIVNGKKIPIWFFVINKIKDIEYGPYTLAQYLEKRSEIGVPKRLRLRVENPDTLYNFKYEKLKYAR